MKKTQLEKKLAEKMFDDIKMRKYTRYISLLDNKEYEFDDEIESIHVKFNNENIAVYYIEKKGIKDWDKFSDCNSI